MKKEVLPKGCPYSLLYYFNVLFPTFFFLAFGFDIEREAKFANLREWSLTSHAQNKPTILKQFFPNRGAETWGGWGIIIWLYLPQ